MMIIAKNRIIAIIIAFALALTMLSACAAGKPNASVDNAGDKASAETSDNANSKYPPGLYMQDGKLMHNGKEYRGIGINYYDGFVNQIDDPLDNTYVKMFKILKDYNVPYARMNFGVYWPIQYKFYEQYKTMYFNMMDAVVKEAEKDNVGIIASLFWLAPAVTDYCDEPLNAWGDPSSKSIAFMKNYVKEVVTRYKDSPAIWAWEFGNEYSLYVDLPNAKDCRPLVNVALGTRSSRDENDDMTTDVLNTALTLFAQEVRKYDKTRLITSGNSVPRSAAYNMKNYGTWTADTEDETAETLKWHNPDPVDCISVHIYEEDKNIFVSGNTFEKLIKVLKETSDKQGKVLFIGEFGGDESTFGDEKLKSNFYRIMDSIVENKVQLGAVWTMRDPKNVKDNILPDNSRAYMLEALKEYNAKIYKELDIS